MNNTFFNNKSLQIIAGLSLAVLVGLGLGYVFFHSSETPDSIAETEHVHEVGAEIWTCSMHPQIRRNEPGDCPICGMDLIPLEGNVSSDPYVLEMTPEAVKLAQIETTVIGKSGSSDKVLNLSGKIQEDERLAASQVVHIPGRIERLYVSFEGEYVRKGQKIARIYSPELITAQQELLQALQLKSTNPGLLTTSRQKLAYWKISQSQIDSIESKGSIQETFDIFADASGIVTSRKVAVGDYLKQGEVLFELVNLSRVWVLFDAYEEDLAQIKIGDQVRFTTASAPGKTFTTRITFIDPIINAQTRVASIRGEISNAQRILKPEMFVKGELLSPASQEKQVLVPKSAVLWTGNRSVVYVKVPDIDIPSFRFQEVELGERMGNNYLIKNGLQSGDEVVTYGSFAIDAAAQLNNQQSMMNRLVGNGKGSSSDLPNFTTLTPEAFQKQLADILPVYLSLKDALVQSDATAAQKHAQALLAKVDEPDMNLLKGEVHNYWMNQVKALKTHTENIASSSDLAHQREQFSFLSTGLIQTLQVFGFNGQKVFVQHCPMGLNNQGADWLSLQEEIRNPYFGDEMLTCGSVTQQFPIQFQQSIPNPNQSHNH